MTLSVRGRRTIRQLVGLTILAMVASLAAVHFAPPAAASPDGTPPVIIDLNQVPLQYQDEVLAFESQAVADVLETHALPASDTAAVKGWARSDVRAQMWTNLVTLIKKDPSSRTPVEVGVYAWFQGLVQAQNVAAANASIAEYLKFSGQTLDTYDDAGAEPLNYNGTTVQNSTAGYCLYDPPAPFEDEFNPATFQPCQTAPGIPVEFLVPSPSYDQFVKYGTQVANDNLYNTPDFNRASFEVAATISTALAMAAVGIAVPLTIAFTGAVTGSITAGTALVRAVFPFVLRGVAMAVGTIVGAAAAVVGTVILAIVTIVLASIQISDQLALPGKLADLLDKATTELPKLKTNLDKDDANAADDSLSDEEQAPKYYPGYFATFLAATLPEADLEPCQGGIVVGGGVYTKGCINQPTPPAAAWDDPALEITPEGSATSTLAQTVNVKQPDGLGTLTTRLSGHGWFVHQSPSGTLPTTQSLSMRYVDWSGKSWSVQRIHDAEHGPRFVQVPIGADGDAEECFDGNGCVVDTLRMTKPDGSHVSVRAVPAPPAPDVTVTSPPSPVQPYTDVVFTATSDPVRNDLVYQWYSDGYCVESADGLTFTCTPLTQVTDPLTGELSFRYVTTGPATTQQFSPGPQTLTLVTTTPNGFRDVQTIAVTVGPAPPDAKVRDQITLEPIVFTGIGDTAEVVATSASGIPLLLSVAQNGVCTLDGTTITTLKAGVCYVTARHDGNASYKPTTISQGFEVPRKPQTLTWSFPPVGGLAPGQTTTLSATATSGGQVYFKVPYASRNVCSVTSNASATSFTLNALADGVCTVEAEQLGTDQWAYVSATRSVTVGKKTQSIQMLFFPPAGGLAVGETMIVGASSLSLLPVTITVDPSSAGVCSYSDSTLTAIGGGTCSITARQPGNETFLAAAPVTRTVQVNRLTQSINMLFFPPDGGIKVGDTLQASASSFSLLPVTITVDEASAGICSYTGTTLTALKAGTCSFTARQAGSSVFLPATPVTGSVQITRKSQSISVLWFPPADGLAYGQTLLVSASSLLLLPVTLTVDDGSSGVCSLSGTTLTAIGVGTCNLTAGQAGNDEYEPTQQKVSVEVVKAAATVHLAGASVQYSDALPGLGVVDHVSGLVGSDTLAGAVTGCSAVATASGKVTSPAGVYPITGCSGLSNANYTVSYTGSVTVTAEDATLSYEGGWYFATGSGGTGTATVSALLKQAADGSPGDPSKVKVDFLLFKSTNLGTTPDFKALDVPVGANGEATTTVSGLPPDFYHVVVRQSAGAGFFAAVGTADDLTVYTPVPGTSASGGGWVVDPTAGGGKRGHFGIAVSITKQRLPSGQVTYRWADPTNGYDYLVKSNSWSGGAAVIAKKTATITAKATLTVINPATGAVVSSLSGGNYTIKVVATDNGPSGSTDTYAVNVKSPAGVVVKQLAPVTVSGGNIAVKS